MDNLKFAPKYKNISGLGETLLQEDTEKLRGFLTS